MNNLFQCSIEIILQNQTPSGAYLASPNFPTYRYCWFRDGAFIAYAMNLAGEHGSAQRFHQWAASAINKRADVVEQAVAKAERGESLTGADHLHTRYSADGSETTDEAWPNFQLDGFGTWLWALGEHQHLSHADLPDDWKRAARLVAEYLTALWPQPCYDCWEEFPDRVHPHTLAAIFGGLQAHARFSGVDHSTTLDALKGYLTREAVADGYFIKFIGSTEVDASLLGLAVPYQVVASDEAHMQATVARIESYLRRGGGLHRYAADTYYGGGEWLLLTAWLGWYYAQVGERKKAEMAWKWIEEQADAQGHLPEQVPATLNDATYYAPWRERWGEIACPLLWSHAKYIVLTCALNRSIG
jgi:GH15 family glucan-1,4-alpha-glucosidase